MAENSENSLCFHCTGCGNCCRDIPLDLTYSEAISWVQDGGSIGLSTAVSLVGGKFNPSFLRKRTYAAQSGTTPIRVALSLITNLQGDCRNLSNNQCAIYDRRPLICRAYPGQVADPLDLFPILQNERCPPEAWSGEILQQGKVLENASMRAAIIEFQRRQVEDLPVLRHLQNIMDITVSSFRLTGILIYELPAENAASLLQEAQTRRASGKRYDNVSWQIYASSAQREQELKQLGLVTIREQNFQRSGVIFASSSPRL